MRHMILTIIVFYSVAFANAADYPTFTDRHKAGPDFRVQGEFVGKVGGKYPIGIQVIALENSKFEGILFGGGLPGAGWDGSTIYYMRGETKDGVTRFQGAHGERLGFMNHNFNGSITKKTFTGTALMFKNRLDYCSFVAKHVVRKSPTLGAKPPKGAIVLFDGKNADEWKDGKIVGDKWLDVGTTSKRQFKSMHLHLEFRCPFMPTARGMHRGNSGVYIRGIWEIQVVDSFGWNQQNRKFERLSGVGKCGGIHEMKAPTVNMSFPPLSWQTFDVDYVAAKFDDQGRKASPPMMTVRHNGVIIHDKYVLPPIPPGGDPKNSQDGKPGPIYLQQHGNPVRYRNIWVIEK